jgi:hypothetical protein
MHNFCAYRGLFLFLKKPIEERKANIEQLFAGDKGGEYQ